MQRLTKSAPAKINLHLHITGRLENGYHTLDSLVAFTNYCDDINVTVSDAFSLDIIDSTGKEISLDCDISNNLISRATYKLAEKCHFQPNIAIKLTKRIPLAAGLGGGSADAAAILIALKDLWPRITPKDLIEVAATLGSDIVACLHQSPVIMRDVGNTLISAPHLPKLYGILVNPNTPCSTPLVYKTYAQNKANFSKDVIFPESFNSTESLYDFLNEKTSNDLTAAAVQTAPIIDTVLHEIRNTPNCRLSRLSGSGATCFGFFDQEDQAIEAVRIIKETHQDWWAVPVIINNQ